MGTCPVVYLGTALLPGRAGDLLGESISSPSEQKQLLSVSSAPAVRISFLRQRRITFQHFLPECPEEQKTSILLNPVNPVGKVFLQTFAIFACLRELIFLFQRGSPQVTPCRDAPQAKRSSNLSPRILRVLRAWGENQLFISTPGSSRRSAFASAQRHRETSVSVIPLLNPGPLPQSFSCFWSFPHASPLSARSMADWPARAHRGHGRLGFGRCVYPPRD
jgi:hypothetical protein